MADCNDLLSGGILKDCDAINAAVGVDKDLILVNYEDFDHTLTKMLQMLKQTILIIMSMD